MARYYILVTAWGFFLYGLLFIVFPQETLQMIVQGQVSTRSELIDLRATYDDRFRAAAICFSQQCKHNKSRPVGCFYHNAVYGIGAYY